MEKYTEYIDRVKASRLRQTSALNSRRTPTLSAGFGKGWRAVTTSREVAVPYDSLQLARRVSRFPQVQHSPPPFVIRDGLLGRKFTSLVTTWVVAGVSGRATSRSARNGIVACLISLGGARFWVGGADVSLLAWLHAGGLARQHDIRIVPIERRMRGEGVVVACPTSRSEPLASANGVNHQSHSSITTRRSQPRPLRCQFIQCSGLPGLHQFRYQGSFVENVHGATATVVEGHGWVDAHGAV